MALTLKIAGVDTPFAPGSVNVTLRQRVAATFACELRWKTNTATVLVGEAVEFRDGSALLFAGTIAEVTEASLSDATDVGLRHHIQCIGWEQRLQNVRCYDAATGTIPTYSRNLTYTVDPATDVITAPAHGRVNGDIVRVKCSQGGVLPGGLAAETDYYVIAATANTLKLSATAGGSAIDITTAGTGTQVLITLRVGEIVADLLATYAAGQGVTAGTIAYGAVVDRVSFDAVTVWEAIQSLAKLSNFYAAVSPAKVLNFQSAIVNPAPFNLAATSAFKSLTVRSTREDKCNDALVRIGWAQAVPRLDTFTGNGSARSWSLSAPAQAIVSIKINGVAMAAGQWLQDTGKNFYWEQGGTTLLQDAADATLTASQQLQVLYYACGQNIVRSADAANMASTAAVEGGTGKYSLLFDRSNVAGEGLIQAAADASAIVAAQEDVAVEISYAIECVKQPLASQLVPGMTQGVVLPYYGISATYLLDSISLRDNTSGEYLMIAARAISGAFLGSYIDYYANLMAGQGGGSGLDSGVVPTTGPVTPADMSVATIHVADLSLYSNSPSAGRVSWLACDVFYKGVKYHIPSGDTDKRFITWTAGAVAFIAGDTYAPTPGLFLIATNTSGTVDEAWNKGGAAAGALQRSNLSFSLMEGFALRPPVGGNLSFIAGTASGSATVLSFTGAGALLTAGLCQTTPYGVTLAGGATMTVYLDVTVDGQPTQTIPMLQATYGATGWTPDVDATTVGDVTGSFSSGTGVMAIQQGISFLSSCVVEIRYAVTGGTIASVAPATTLRGVVQWASKI